jgi:hypothetical protein
MSGHILIAKGDITVRTRRLINELASAQRLTGNLPDIEYARDRTIVVMDPAHEDIIPDFERIGFERQRDEDSF